MTVCRTICWLTLALLAMEMPLLAQDPGQTKPCLEALVANSSEIALVRMRQADVAADERRVKQLEVEVVRRLKRPIPDDVNGNQPEAPALLPLTLTWQGEEVNRLRWFDDFYWSVDLSTPGSSLSSQITKWQPQATELLLFSGFQSPHSGTLDFLVDPADGKLFLADLTPVKPEEVHPQIASLVDRYRGVQALHLVLIETAHFRTAYQRSGICADHSFTEARALIIPGDGQFERLMLAQISDPQLLHEQNFTVSQVDWLRYTPQITSFASEANTAFLQKLLTDPEVGTKQRQLLTDILARWSSEQ